MKQGIWKYVLAGLLFAILIFVVSCATPYKPLSITGGFSEVKIQEGMYKVYFKGNAYIGEERIRNYTLYRCAEITLENHYQYFIILEDNISERKGYITDTNKYGSNTYEYKKLTGGYTIQCFADKPETNKTIYNAKEIKKNLSPYINEAKSRSCFL